MAQAQKRARVEQLRADRERARLAAERQARTRRVFTVAVVVIAVVAVMIGLAFATKNHGKPAATSSGTQEQVSASALAALKVPASVSQQIGTGGTTGPQKIAGSPLTKDGKPEVLYVGAEFCPFCGGQRWGLVMALQRFGTWQGLTKSHSDPGDQPTNIPTFGFVNATYKSDYVSFVSYETKTIDHQPLQTLPQDVTDLVNKYNSGGGIPWVDVANAYAQQGASFVPMEMQNKSFDAIVSTLGDPSSKITKDIVGTANQYTAAICKVTGDQPGKVCSAPEVKAIEAHLG